MDRYTWLEQQLDREDLTDEEFNVYNRELNALQERINTRQAEAKKRRELKDQEDQEQKEMAKVLSLTEEQVDKMYEEACIKCEDINGMSFRSWYEQSLKYYDIDENLNVHAHARGPNSAEIIPHPTLAQAKLTILRRIKYKFYDHAIRGRDFKWEIS